MNRPDPRPRPTGFLTRWSYRQHRKAWLRRHGGSLVIPLLVAVTVGVLSGSAVAMLVVAGVAFGAAAYQRSRSGLGCADERGARSRAAWDGGGRGL